MDKPTIIYSNGEVAILLNETCNSIKSFTGISSFDVGDECTALEDLRVILKEIQRNYKTLSEGYLEVLIAKQKRKNSKLCNEQREILGKYRGDIFNVLFHIDFDKMPLLLNNKVTGHIATVRLRIGR